VKSDIQRTFIQRLLDAAGIEDGLDEDAAVQAIATMRQQAIDDRRDRDHFKHISKNNLEAYERLLVEHNKLVRSINGGKLG
jgi:hypothetical protein